MFIEYIQTTKYVILLSVLVLMTSQASAADVAVTPSNNTVIQGQTFNLNVSIDPQGTAIAGAQLSIRFNKSMLWVNSIAEGDLFKQNGARTFFKNGTIDNSLGTVKDIFGVVISRHKVSTPGTFIIINMTATGERGTSEITLLNVKISDTNGNKVALNLINGSVSVSQSNANIISPPASTPTPYFYSDIWGRIMEFFYKFINGYKI